MRVVSSLICYSCITCIITANSKWLVKINWSFCRSIVSASQAMGFRAKDPTCSCVQIISSELACSSWFFRRATNATLSLCPCHQLSVISSAHAPGYFTENQHLLPVAWTCLLTCQLTACLYTHPPVSLASINSNTSQHHLPFESVSGSSVTIFMFRLVGWLHFYCEPSSPRWNKFTTLMLEGRKLHK